MADGELDVSESATSCTAWRAHGALRADWHAWHLIGDVLRSDDLAADPKRDQQLFLAVQARLRSEPVVLAPAPVVASPGRLAGARHRPRRWGAGAAVAAGVVLVVGTYVVVRPGGPPAPVQLARSEIVAPVATATLTRSPAVDTAPAVAIVADNKLIRDARLDRYLDAHKQFAGSSALGVPSAFLRSATVDSASR